MSLGNNAPTSTAVIGGGIIGLAIAFELTRHGRRVTVLEANRIGEGGAATVAAGMVAPHAEADVSHPQLTRMALESHRLYPEFVKAVESSSGREVGYDRTGTLFVALHSDHRRQLDHLQRFTEERGLCTIWLTGREVRELEPFLSPHAVGGLLFQDDHQVDPRRLLRALAGAVLRSGGTILESARALTVGRGPEGGVVAYEQGGRRQELHSREGVLAAGAWSTDVSGWAPRAGLYASSTAVATQVPLRPVKGEILRLRGEPLLRHVVRTPDVYLVPRDDGELVVGATSEERGFDRRVTAGAVLHLLREAWRVLPAVDELELAECGVGFRPAVRDNLPAIGPTDIPGFYLATGHFRNGVELAPLTARLVGSLICGQGNDPLLNSLNPGRFTVPGNRPLVQER